MSDIRNRVSALEKRNKRVESDKAWETSWVRRLLIALLTYFVASLYLFVIDTEKPLLGALVPAGGYLLSTLLVRTARDMWESRR